MVVESDYTAAAFGSPDGPVLAEVAVVLGPQLILCIVTVVVAVERLTSIIRRVVFCKCFYHVELDEGVLGEAVESEIGAAGEVALCGVVDNTAWMLADVFSSDQMEDEQIWASFLALASHEVTSKTEYPV